MFTQYIHAVLFTIIFATLLQSGYSQEGDDWNYLVLSLTWPPTFCSKVECKLPPRMNDFNIHGLWPSVWPGRQPTNCSAHPAFDIDKLSDLRGQLDSEWVNLMDYQNPIPFWEHEWYKHGQCATEDTLISDELGYFNTSLILKDKIDLLNMLNSYGIQPANDQLLGNRKEFEIMVNYGITYHRQFFPKDLNSSKISLVTCEISRTDFKPQNDTFFQK
ncbi:unnamed protein product [Trichobilharzia szidati]|nr:unnamed protein product [Trichobilharzia szidati]